jgi:hypothetical protein
MRNRSKDGGDPERQMAARALVPGVVLSGAAFGVGVAANGIRAGVSALLGVLLVSLTFALYVVALGRARRISLSAMHAVTLGGWILRLAVIVGALFAVDAAGGDVAAFGFAAIVTAVSVASFEAWAVLTGRIRAPLEMPSPTPDRLGSGAQ